MPVRWFDNYPLARPFDFYFDHWFWDVAPRRWEYFGGGPMSFQVTNQDCTGVEVSWKMPWLWSLSWARDIVDEQDIALGFEIVVYNEVQYEPFLLNVDDIREQVIYRKKIYPSTVATAFGSNAKDGESITANKYISSFLTTGMTHSIPRRVFNGLSGQVTIAIHANVAISSILNQEPLWLDDYTVPRDWGNSYSTPFTTVNFTLALPDDTTCGGPGPVDDSDSIPESNAAEPFPPIVGTLRVNNVSNPLLIKSTEPLLFYFTITDFDGPNLSYTLSVIDKRGLTPATIWTTGEVFLSGATGQSTITVAYSGPSLAPGVQYYWKVDVSDGDSETADASSSGNDFFSLNGRPSITSFQANSQEMLFGVEADVASDSVVISWSFSDPDFATQQRYELVLFGSDGTEIIRLAGLDASTVTITDFTTLEASKDYVIKLKVNDGVEYSQFFTGKFFANARPELDTLRVGGEENSTEIDTTTPVISWRFLDENSADAQTKFRIQVALEDDEFSVPSLVWDTGEVMGSSANGAIYSVTYGTTSSPTVAPAALSHGLTYYVRVKVFDGVSWSDYSDETVSVFFIINTRPNDPTLTLPTIGEYAGNIQIQWVAASPEDDDGDDIFYTLEYTDSFSTDTRWKTIASPLPSTQLRYDWDITEIPKGNNYAVRVTASDGYSESIPFNGGTSPRFTILNHAPNVPTIVSPETSFIARRELRVAWEEPQIADIDGDQVYYQLEITDESSEMDPEWVVIGKYQQGISGAVVSVSGFEDGTDFKVRIKAIDEEGAESAYSTSPVFVVSNLIEIKDFEKLNSTIYMSSSDGRVFSGSPIFWQKEILWTKEAASGQNVLSSPTLGKFVRGQPFITIEDGGLIIRNSSSSAYILRDTE